MNKANRERAKDIYNNCKTHGDIVDLIQEAIESRDTISALTAENEQLREALKQAKELVYYHHEVGHIRHAAENIFDNCDVCEKDERLKKLLDAVRALAQTRS